MIALRLVWLMTTAIMICSVVTVAAQTTAPNSVPCGRFIGRYSLILFDFDSDRIGAMNQRVLREHIYPEIAPGTAIEVIGHTDIVGLDDHNLQLTKARATNVASGIRSTALPESIATLTVKAVGESAPIYTNFLPEGRLYNRTVQVITDAPTDCP
ncbi:MAG: OmpA family protein [Armatimonadetes bacterium]|nr:OmpA family protein [Armatimonadota bacterium]